VVHADRLELGNEDLGNDADSPRLRRLLGSSMAMVFQDPLSALNPALRVWRHLAEVAEVHQSASRRAAKTQAVHRLGAVGLPAPELQARKYPTSCPVGCVNGP
jgi:peptide/nickel transport system permease protein